MGKLKLKAAQQELLRQGQIALEQVQEQNRTILTTILAGEDIRRASNVRVSQDGTELIWDDPDAPPKGGQGEGDQPVPPKGPALVEGDSGEPQGAGVPESVEAPEEPAVH